MDVDLDDVRIFNHVAQAQSFTAAAQLLQMPKSTVSRRVSHLEEQLGVRLLHRTTRKLRLTHAGELYFRHTAQCIEELASAGRLLEELQDTPSGLLRITTPVDLGGSSAAMIAAFCTKYPRIRIYVLATGRRVDLVAEGIDIAIRAGTLSDSSMMSKKLASSRAALYASPSYLKQHGTPCAPADLSTHNCLLMGPEGGSGSFKLFRGEEATEIDVSGNFTTNDLNALTQAAVQGMGIAILPRFEVRIQVKQGSLVRLLPSYLSREFGLFALYPSAKHLSPKVRLFVDFASEWMKAYQAQICSDSGEATEESPQTRQASTPL